MVEKLETRLYDLHLLYEVGYDDYPKVLVYKLWKDKNGDWNTESGDIVDRYDFTEQDVDWLESILPEKELSAFHADEWTMCHPDRIHTLSFSKYLPPKAIEMLENLPPYSFYQQ